MLNAQPKNAAAYSVIVTNENPVARPGEALWIEVFVDGQPTIVRQPESQTVTAGGDVTFSVTATGTPPLDYVWRFNGTAIAGATNSTYTIVNAQRNNAGRYDVVISNEIGSETSTAAIFSLEGPIDTDGDGLPDDWETANGLDPMEQSDAALDPDGDGLTNVQEYRAGTDPQTPNGPEPQITGSPAHQTVFQFETATFNVSAIGTPPLSYQWTFNGFPMPGETNAMLVIRSVLPAIGGDYAVSVSDSAGSATSVAATLEIGFKQEVDAQNPGWERGVLLVKYAPILGRNLMGAVTSNTPINRVTFPASLQALHRQLGVTTVEPPTFVATTPRQTWAPPSFAPIGSTRACFGLTPWIIPPPLTTTECLPRSPREMWMATASPTLSLPSFLATATQDRKPPCMCSTAPPARSS